MIGVFDVVGCEEKVGGGDDVDVSVLGISVEVGVDDAGVDDAGAEEETGGVGLPVPDVGAKVVGARRPTFIPSCRQRQ